jgi:hypothetical protein
MLGNIIRNGNVFTMSLVTFLDTVDRKFFTPNFETYEKLKYFNDPTGFKLLVIGLYIGIVIASLCAFYNRRVLGKLIRRLDAEGCDSPENAKTLEGIGLDKNIFIKFSLMCGGAVRRVVAFSPTDTTRVGGIIAYASLNKERYRLEDPIYLAPEKRDGTLSRFRAKGSGWISVLLTVVLGLVVVALIMRFAPFAVRIIDNMLIGFDPASNVVN